MKYIILLFLLTALCRLEATEKPIFPYLRLESDWKFSEIGACTFHWTITYSPDFPFDKARLYIRQGNESGGLSGRVFDLREKPTDLYFSIPRVLKRHDNPKILDINYFGLVTIKEARLPFEGYIQAAPESFGLYSLSAELLPDQPVPLIEFSVAREKTVPNYGYLTHPESDIKFFLQHAPWQFNPANTVTLLLEIAGIGPEEAAQFRTPLQAECEKRAAEYISAIPENLPAQTRKTLETLYAERLRTARIWLGNNREYHRGRVSLETLAAARAAELTADLNRLKLLRPHFPAESYSGLLQKLTNERHDAFSQLLQMQQEKYKAGALSLDEVLAAHETALNTELIHLKLLKPYLPQAEYLSRRRQALEERCNILKQLYSAFHAQYEAGAIPQEEVRLVRQRLKQAEDARNEFIRSNPLSPQSE